jgi:hypothetical protein
MCRTFRLLPTLCLYNTTAVTVTLLVFYRSYPQSKVCCSGPATSEEQIGQLLVVVLLLLDERIMTIQRRYMDLVAMYVYRIGSDGRRSS